MYKISEFSRITNLTVKTLRYYDEEGILLPSHRDAYNGYRYYTIVNMTTICHIILKKRNSRLKKTSGKIERSSKRFPSI